jgi:hypothetical protein
MGLTSLILGYVSSRMWVMSWSHIMSFNDGFLLHQILHRWPMRRSNWSSLSELTTLHCVIVECVYLQRPNIEAPNKFTPLFRCSLKTLVSKKHILVIIWLIVINGCCAFQSGWPRCDFNEYIHGPRSEWPTESEVKEFESRTKPWPCLSYPPSRCKCGIVATEGVVPSELGFGMFCGNAYGDFWMSMMWTCLLLLALSSLLSSFWFNFVWCDLIFYRRGRLVIGSNFLVAVS